MNDSRMATYGVLAFGAMMAFITVVLTTYQVPAPTGDNFRLSAVSQLHGRWKTRTVAEDRLNGAYNGLVVFGEDYYQIQNDVVVQPVRIDNVRYALNGNHIELWVEGNRAIPTIVTLLREDRATIQMPNQDNLVLYMYKQE